MRSRRRVRQAPSSHQSRSGALEPHTVHSRLSAFFRSGIFILVDRRNELRNEKIQGLVITAANSITPLIHLFSGNMSILTHMPINLFIRWSSRMVCSVY